MKFYSIIFFLMLAIIFSCKSKKEKKEFLFDVLTHKQTGLDFANHLKASPSFNMFHYMYFYNGAGIGAGDFNNDGLIDLFFAANQVGNRLYLNKGDMQFRDVTDSSRIPKNSSWSTGVSIVDINNDGLLDIYVCKVGQYEALKGKNELLICTGISAGGIPQYVDRAAEYGLDFSGFSTQSAFFDYDLDGDLDMFLLNHSVHHNGTFGPRNQFLGTYHTLSGDRMFRNDGARFTEVTRETGINSSAIGYGLGIAISDINLDGYPDIFIGNDFHENDYLYINQGNGTFSEEMTQRTMHTSQFSMGVDVADVNNDGQPELISMDMLPYDPYILKRSLGEDRYETFYMKVGYGYHHQYARNNLQLNLGNGTFSEIGMFAGVHATDWSWAPLWMDFDNDGLKDLFVSNGIPKRMNDMDYINFVSDEAIQSKIRNNTIRETEMALVDKFPEIKLPNKFYRNNGAMAFEDLKDQIGNDQETFSNGAIYADLDNDGDLDVVVNNIDAEALIYQNNTSTTSKDFIKVDLKGPGKNLRGIGTKLLIFEKNGLRTYEKFPVRGFESSMEIPLHAGIKNLSYDSILLVWPDNTYQRLEITPGQSPRVEYKAGLPSFDYSFMQKRRTNEVKLEDVSVEAGLTYKHIENNFVEFNREPLIPHMISTEGPALAVADINGDGLDDFYIGSSKFEKAAVFIQESNNKFRKTIQPAIDADSTYEEVDAKWIDVNGDKYVDLVVANGGNEYYGRDKYMEPRLYLNDGKGNLSLSANAFRNIYMNAGCIAPVDINKDGHMDIFIGGRTVPWEYGLKPQSYMLMNDGSGQFRESTQTNGELKFAGMVTSASWVDIDNDSDQDLLLSLEWGTICVFINDAGQLKRRDLTTRKGWWNFVTAIDTDNDGDLDLVAGNVGRNSRLKPTEDEPVTLYYNDFDDNGKNEQVVTYFLNGKEIPFPNKMEMEKQLPALKKKFLYAEDFAEATLKEIISGGKLSGSSTWSVDYFENAILINNGNLQFELKALPWQTQLTSYRCGLPMDANGDKLPDIFLGGNFYDNNIDMGRYDSDYGTVLVNLGNNNFTPYNTSVTIKGQVRKIENIGIGGEKMFLLARNNDSLMILRKMQKKNPTNKN